MSNYPPHPLPGLFGLVFAPITESVANVAINGSDSNQRLRTYTHKNWNFNKKKAVFISGNILEL